MSVLTTPTANGQLLWSIACYLARSGPMPASDLMRSYCLPVDMETGPPAIWLQTVQCGIILGALASTSPGNQAAQSGQLSVVETPDDNMQAWLRQLVFSEQNVAAQLLGQTAPGATDLVAALAWIATLDPYTAPVGASAVERLQIDHDLPKVIVSNNTQWRAAARWAWWTGIALPLDHSGYDLVPSIIPDVRAVMPAKGSIAVHELIDLVTDRIPILPEGRIGKRFSTEVGSDTTTAISPILSHALRSLAEQGVLRLTAPRDAGIIGTSELLLHPNETPVSQVEVLQ
jgi:hypothetical protein